MDMNEELTRELKAAHWRIVKLAIDDGARMRSTVDEASATVARVSQGVEVEDPGVVDAQSTRS